ncbi:hypothetical protein [uncultured Friedmanniella sp.]|uniref:hypothetical protein n=1 Tax=uncultured Friedmanniella sp. TaxID=335381 RepID=UPI0035C9C88A
MSTALTVDNRDQAITAAHAQYAGYLVGALSEHQRILAAAKRSEEKGRDYPDPVHVAKLEVIVRALEDLAGKYGVAL